MIIRLSKTLAALGFAIACGIPAAPAQAADANHKIADGVEIYLGVVPAETMRKQYSTERAESSMHGGIPSGAGHYHVNVSLFDARTKTELRDAQVRARVEEIGAGSESKKLEPFAINNTVSYGNYFKMAGKGPYWITVQIRRPGSQRMLEAKFEHKNF
jgi:hypothetical protein